MKILNICIIGDIWNKPPNSPRFLANITKFVVEKDKYIQHTKIKIADLDIRIETSRLIVTEIDEINKNIDKINI